MSAEVQHEPERTARLRSALQEMILKIMINLNQRGYGTAEILDALESVCAAERRAYETDPDPADDPPEEVGDGTGEAKSARPAAEGNGKQSPGVTHEPQSNQEVAMGIFARIKEALMGEDAVEPVSETPVEDTYLGVDQSTTGVVAPIETTPHETGAEATDDSATAEVPEKRGA